MPAARHVPMRKLLHVVTLLCVLTVPAMARAQATRCIVPTQIDTPRIEVARPDQVRRTPVTRYLLSLSWSPQHCRDVRVRADRGAGSGDGQGRSGDTLQCGGSNGEFGFVLHGLWPETDGRDWPQYCAPARRLSRATIRRNLCMTPSVQLLQHEWARHGVCMTRNPDAYFRAAGLLYRAVRYPDMRALAADDSLTVGAFARAFAAANPAYPAESIAVETGGGGFLDEVRLCLDRRFRPQRCPPESRGANLAQRLRIEPPR